ncbi:NAD(P)-binding protein [Gymnopus androsaceus JB14]|uniref:NAD(P)-binding protein n=1 Tax=Gymnopus androsaceus JB14 TaxID=1447944 RepID=A0A6A4HJ57_9AGAR|nr:NAD(P)-binding protein [Gymnopus androsaceus JB14]
MAPLRDAASYGKPKPKVVLPPVVKGDLTGKTVIVTGANIGLGFEAAKHFATMNPAQLIIVCRSMEKAQASIKQIEKETGYKNAEPMVLDLGKWSSISEHWTVIDILVENAAVGIPGNYVPTEDGWESIGAAFSASISSDAYLLNIMLVRKLAEHLPQNVVPVTLSPGFCVSGLRRWAVGEVAEQFKKMEDESAYTSEEGSRHIIYSAIGGKDEELRGAFMSYLEPAEISAWMLKVEMIELFGKLDDRIPGIVAQYLKA